MEETKYYRHSGSVSGGGLVLGTIAASIGVAIAAAIYAAAVLYIPLAGVITFVLAAGFGSVAGFIVGHALQFGKLRNDKIAFLVASVLALEALYVSWASWTTLLLWRSDVEASFLPLLESPALLWSVVRELNGVGAWSVGGFSPTGGLLWALWGLEALIILGLATLVPLGILTLPFCERCERWSKLDEDIARFADTDSDSDSDSDSLKSSVEGGAVEFLSSLGKPSVKDTTWLRADLHRCPSCDDLHTLTLSRVTVTNDKGERKENAQSILQHLLLPKTAAAALRELA